jgi:excinuclease ABC subunit B
MKRAIEETTRRRIIQREHNEEHGIEPRSVLSHLDTSLAEILKAEYGDPIEESKDGEPEFTSAVEVEKYLESLEKEMRDAAKKFEFERAAKLRDKIKDLRDREFLFG